MKKKSIFIGISILLFIGLFILTGCSNKDDKNEIDKVAVALNNAVIEIQNDTEESDIEYTVSLIQNKLERYTIISVGKDEYTKPINSESFETSLYMDSSSRFSRGSATNIMVYDKETQKYYALTIGYYGYTPSFAGTIELKRN